MLQKCKNNILSRFQIIKSLPKNAKTKSCILILDTITASILSDILTLEELLEADIQSLERVDKIRKPQPSSIAIYYISCQSIPFVFKDFQVKNSNNLQESQLTLNENSMYFSANLLMSEVVSQQNMRKIGECDELIERLGSFGQMYVPYRFVNGKICIVPFSKEGLSVLEQLKGSNNKNQVKQKIEDQRSSFSASSKKRTITAYHSNKNKLSCLSDIFSYELDVPSNSKIKQKFEQIQEKISAYGRELCLAIFGSLNIGVNTSFKIVWQSSKFTEKFKANFYSILQQCLQSLQQQSQDSSILESNEDLKQVVIILADRTIDSLSPLIRSYLYWPFLMDFIANRHGPEKKVSIIRSTKVPPTVIDADDEIFASYRSTNILTVFQRIDDDLKHFISTNKTAQHLMSDKKKNQFELKERSASSFKSALKELPAYNKKVASYKCHIDLLHALASLKKQLHVDQLYEIEQMIITGYNKQNKTEKDKKILQKLEIMLTRNSLLTVEDRARLLILAGCLLDIGQQERGKLVQRLSKIEGHGKIAMGLSKLAKLGAANKYPVSSFSLNNPQHLTTFDKYQGIISTVVEELIKNGNVKNKKFRLQDIKNKGGKDNKGKGKKGRGRVEYVICMSGGLGYNEVADIQRIGRNFGEDGVGINFITDFLFTPQQYMEQLCTIL